MMIQIQKSPTADTRTCDFTSVSKQQLLDSSEMPRPRLVGIAGSPRRVPHDDPLR